ncbi:MAG: glycosyltransferase [Bacteroidaceae bacterium]|nr:glycosyltransferase [Bacteroidaceae bacterium]
MKLSVIIGVYNNEETLQEALDSLYAQTYKDFEIIICDDGSTDGTWNIISQNAELHENVVAIRNEKNLGLNATLNRCLELAKGEYIARMDGDDISLSERFEKEVRFLDEHPEYSIVSCPLIYFDETGEIGRGKGGYEPTKNDFMYGTPLCHAASMIRRSALDAVGGYSVSPKLLRVEDYHLWMKMYAIGLRGYNLSECLYMARDGKKAHQRRSFRNRWNEMYVHFLACRTLHLPLKGYVYCILPILKWLVPKSVYRYYHRKRLYDAE